MAETRSLVKLKNQLETIKNSKKRAIEHAKRGFAVAGDAMVTNSTALLCGFVQGRYGGYKLFGHVPFELVLAAGFHGAGIFGPKNAAHQLHNLGNGALCAYTVAVGRGFGKTQRAKSGEKPLLQGISEGLDQLMGDGDGGGALSTADLIAMANRA